MVDSVADDEGESGDQDQDSTMGSIRRRGQALVAGAKDIGTAAGERIRSNETGAKALDALGTAGRSSADSVKKASGAVDREVGRRTDNLTLGPYRQELDMALAELVAVVIAQDAEIRALKDRVAELERGDIQ